MSAGAGKPIVCPIVSKGVVFRAPGEVVGSSSSDPALCIVGKIGRQEGAAAIQYFYFGLFDLAFVKDIAPDHIVVSCFRQYAACVYRKAVWTATGVADKAGLDCPAIEVVFGAEPFGLCQQVAVLHERHQVTIVVLDGHGGGVGHVFHYQVVGGVVKVFEEEVGGGDACARRDNGGEAVFVVVHIVGVGDGRACIIGAPGEYEPAFFVLEADGLVAVGVFDGGHVRQVGSVIGAACAVAEQYVACGF